MTLSLRAVLISLIVVFVFAGFGYACPQWTAKLGLDVWNYSDYQRMLRESKQEAAELNDVGRRIRQRISLKMLITRDLLSKRINLAQATEQFLDLNKVEPQALTDACRQHPAAGRKEIAAIQVISFARAELADNPSRCQEVVCDLQQQLQEMQDDLDETE